MPHKPDFISIKIADPPYCRVKSHKKVVIVQFKNQTFKWLPTYEQLDKIRAKIDKVEVINKKIKEGR